jgi:hypothetical protein
MNGWKRLTLERMNRIVAINCEINCMSFRDYDIQYMVLPEGDWTDIHRWDNKIRSNVHRYDPKVVYRFRPKDKADIAWQKYQSEMGAFCGKENDFKAGYKAGFSDGKEL